MIRAAVIIIDDCAVAGEMRKDQADPKTSALYLALDMPFAVLVGQLAGAFARR